MKAGGHRRPARAAVFAAVFLLLPLSRSAAQNSNQIYDHMLFARGSALGSQALAGDLLAAALDPTVASGGGLDVEAAGGSHELDLDWTAVGARFEGLGHRFAIVLAALSYGSQLRTALDDRLGLFGGSFTPSDVSLTGATVLVDDAIVTIGVSATLTFAQLDDAKATLFSAAVAARRRFGALEIRGGVSNLGTALSPFGSDRGTSLPARLRAGAAYAIPTRPLELSGEWLYRFGDEVFNLSVGGEWRPLPPWVLRLGLVGGEGADRWGGGGPADLGLTMGVAWRTGQWRLSYVYRPGGVLGDGHLFSLGWSPGTAR